MATPAACGALTSSPLPSFIRPQQTAPRLCSSADLANCAAHHRLGLRQARLEAGHRALFGVAHAAQFVGDGVALGFGGHKRDALLIAVDLHLAHARDAGEAFADGVSQPPHLMFSTSKVKVVFMWGPFKDSRCVVSKWSRGPWPWRNRARGSVLLRCPWVGWVRRAWRGGACRASQGLA